MQLVFFGDFTPFTAAHLFRCRGAGHRVNAFVTAEYCVRVRRPQDRYMSVLAPNWSVGAQLRRARIPIFVTKVPVSVPELMTHLSPLGGDALVSVGFPGRIPKPIADLYPAGAINVHPALLPNYRGPHPTLAMVLDAGLAKGAGTTIHLLTDAFDEGPILAQAALPGAADLPLERLSTELARLGARLLEQTLADLPARIEAAQPQPAATSRPGRVTRREITIEPARTTTDDVRKFVSLGRMRVYPQVRLADRMVKVDGPARVVGRPSGRRGKVRTWSVEFDTADARVRVFRARKMRRQLNDWRHILPFIGAGDP